MPDPSGWVSHEPIFHRGVSWKQPVRVASTGNVALATAVENGDTIDGVVLATGDRVLLKDQTAGIENGIYDVQASGPPLRSFDMDQDATFLVPASEVIGAVVLVTSGTANAGTIWRNTNTSLPVLGTTALTFGQIVTSGATAALVSVADAAGYFTGTNVETVLAELGALTVGVTAHGNTGSTETFAATTATHTATLNAATVTFTLTALASGLLSTLELWLTQDGTGGRVISLPASVTNKTALEAAQVTTAGTTQILVLLSVDGGTNWIGFWAGGSSVSALNDLSDVTITSPTVDQMLFYDGAGQWINSSAIWRPVMDGAGNVVTDGGTGEAIMALS